MAAAAGTRPPEDIIKFMDKAVELNMSGVSFWSWDYCRLKLPLIWDTIAEYEWPTDPNPKLDVTESLINAFNDVNVNSNRRPVYR